MEKNGIMSLSKNGMLSLSERLQGSLLGYRFTVVIDRRGTSTPLINSSLMLLCETKKLIGSYTETLAES